MIINFGFAGKEFALIIKYHILYDKNIGEAAIFFLHMMCARFLFFVL